MDCLVNIDPHSIFQVVAQGIQVRNPDEKETDLPRFGEIFFNVGGRFLHRKNEKNGTIFGARNGPHFWGQKWSP